VYNNICFGEQILLFQHTADVKLVFQVFAAPNNIIYIGSIVKL